MAQTITDLSPRELAAWLADDSRPSPVLLDVREDWEYEHCHIAGARHIPMAQIPAHLAELGDAGPLVCICHHGVRSMQVAAYLARLGEAELFNLRGGMDAWAQDVDASMPRY